VGESLLPFVDELPLVDHHCHGVLRTDVDRPGFERLLTEADTVSPWGTTLFDSSLGFAVRRWCAPLLGLPAHAPAEDYLARRGELGAAEVTRTFLEAARIHTYLVDTGLMPDRLLAPAELAGVTGAQGFEIVRLEWLAEQVVRAGTTAAGFADQVRATLSDRAHIAVGAKSVAAYRVGLELGPDRPSDGQVMAAAGRWLSRVDGGAPIRCADDVLSRFLVWEALERELPVQFHIGLGDSDLDLHRCDPLLLTDFLRATAPRGVPIMLLHNYPFHRGAGYLAQVFPHVFVDLGLATHNTGHQASRVLAEALEIVPFGKFLFSTDAFGLPELYHLGALLFRRALSDFLSTALSADALAGTDAERVARLIGCDNARRAYRLDEHGTVGGPG
jgi:predicted TIM-barrel fold metal-dependent hydrolase